MTHVYRLDVSPAAVPGKLGFSVSGTKGLIVRTLVNDFGDALGCGACLESLRRTRSGRFSVEDAIPFDKLLDTGIDDFASLVVPVTKAMP